MIRRTTAADDSVFSRMNSSIRQQQQQHQYLDDNDDTVKTVDDEYTKNNDIDFQNDLYDSTDNNDDDDNEEDEECLFIDDDDDRSGGGIDGMVGSSSSSLSSISCYTWWVVKIILTFMALMTVYTVLDKYHMDVNIDHIKHVVQQQQITSKNIEQQEDIHHFSSNYLSKDAGAVQSQQQHSYYIQHMIEMNLTKSVQHTKKLWQNRHVLELLDIEQYRYIPDNKNCCIPITNEFVYLHVWQSGGTTIEQQTNNTKKLTWDDVLRGSDKLQYATEQLPNLFTFVRDPIDHFLSGWAEVMVQSSHGDALKAYKISKGLSFDFSTTINDFLEKVKKIATTKRHNYGYYQNPFPQINFLLSKYTNMVPAQLQVVGDLSEMPGVLSTINFVYDPTKGVGKNSSENTIKIKYFPVHRNKLNNRTLQRLCEFVALDYYLFDFELPETCKYDVPYSKHSLLHILNLTQFKHNSARIDSGQQPKSAIEQEKIPHQHGDDLNDKQQQVVWSDEHKHYIQQMIQLNLTRSVQHMNKLWQNKDVLVGLDRKKYTYHAKGRCCRHVTNEFVYIHVWKSGGTTMAIQTNHTKQLRWDDVLEGKNENTKEGIKDKGSKLSIKSLSTPKLFSFVRDPIDHFLSGWAEFMKRLSDEDETRAYKISERLSDDLSSRISHYLKKVQKATKSHDYTDYEHSFPQINFLLSKYTNLLPTNLQIVGDLSEMIGVLSMINFTYNPWLGNGRNATQDTIKQKYFSVQRNQLNNKTLHKLCEFVALDYYLFDFVLPDTCKYDIPYSKDSLLYRLNLTHV